MKKDKKLKELLKQRQELITKLKKTKPSKGQMYSCGMHRQGVIYLQNDIKTLNNQIDLLKSHYK